MPKRIWSFICTRKFGNFTPSQSIPIFDCASCVLRLCDSRPDQVIRFSCFFFFKLMTVDCATHEKARFSALYRFTALSKKPTKAHAFSYSCALLKRSPQPGLALLLRFKRKSARF
nr:hypothetical protein Iba_chr12bCG18580 [Ipomoea batatas]